jgi:hypothetical protein
MITEEKSPMRVFFFRDHEIGGAGEDRSERPQHFKPGKGRKLRQNADNSKKRVAFCP